MTNHPTNPTTGPTTDPATSPGSSASAPAFRAAWTRDWPAYFDAVAGKPPRETLCRALDLFDADLTFDAATAHAIDLGCGEGRDTMELLKRGWSVLAIDGHPDAIRRLVLRQDLAPTPRLRMQLTELESLELPPVRLVNASFTLPFCRPDAFDRLWRTIVDAIEPGGRFAGQIFGDRDTWAALPDRTHHTRDQAEALFRHFDLERFTEDEHDAADAQGQDKHWHVFHVVARKRR